MKGPALFGVLAAVGLLGGGGSAVGARHGILFLRAYPRLGSAQVYVWRPGAAAAPIGPSTKTIDSVQWSPDGRQIAFTAQPAGGMPDANPEDVYLMRPDGTSVRQLTHDPAHRVVSPSWSPDGSQIVFERLIENSPYYILAVVSARTGAERSLHVAGLYPTWGKPGVAYKSDAGPIMLLNPATGRSKVFVASSDNVYPFAWSNRGDLAVMQGSFGHTAIATYSARGRALTRFQLRLPYSEVCGVSWSPGGTRLLLTVKGLLTVRNRLFHGHGPPLDKYAGLWTTTLAGKDRQRLLRFQPNGSCQTSWR